jgi:hypothetical protein
MMVSNQLPLSVSHGACSMMLDALDGVPLAGKPAFGEQVGRQHLVLQLVAGGGGDRPAHGGGGGLATRESQPALGEHQYRQLGASQAFFVPVGNFGVGRQAEAVGAVAGQGQQVGQIADRREGRAAGAVRPARVS